MIADHSQTAAPPAAAWEHPAPGPAVIDREASARLMGYVLLRVTGVVLSVLVIGHFVVVHFVTDVARDNSAFVARRLSSAVWATWDATMLAAALAHGAIGLRLVLADYADGRRARVLGRGVLALTTVLFVLGAIAIARAAHV